MCLRDTAIEPRAVVVDGRKLALCPRLAARIAVWRRVARTRVAALRRVAWAEGEARHIDGWLFARIDVPKDWEGRSECEQK